MTDYEINRDIEAAYCNARRLEHARRLQDMHAQRAIDSAWQTIDAVARFCAYWIVLPAGAAGIAMLAAYVCGVQA